MIDIPAFNFVDALAAIVLLVGLLGGLKRGLSGELSRVIAIAVAAFSAWRFATPVAEWGMEKLSMTQERAYVFSFLAILLAAFLVMWLIRITLRNLMEFAFKGRIERMGGALAGLLRALVIVAALVLMISFAPQPEIQRIVMKQSFCGRLVAKYLRPVYEDLQQRAPEFGLPAPPAIEDPDLGESDNTTDGENIEPPDDIPSP